MSTRGRAGKKQAQTVAKIPTGRNQSFKRTTNRRNNNANGASLTASKVNVPKIFSPYGIASPVGRSTVDRKTKSKPSTTGGGRKTKRGATNDNMTHIVVSKGNDDKGKQQQQQQQQQQKQRKTSSASTSGVTKMPRNLNTIKDIKNNKIVCNNVVVDVEGCYDPMIQLDDIAAPNFPKFSMNAVEDSVVQWICEHGKGETVLIMMAWLRNKRILRCLIDHAKRVLVLVNDEDCSTWSKTLEYYDKLPKFEEPLHSAFFGSKSVLRALDRDDFGNKFQKCTYEQVRCFGNSSFDSNGGVTSLMHNKIIIFCKEKRLPGGKIVETPTSFITGSYNCTENASNNIENAIWIPSKKGAEHCFYQFSLIMAHSRSLRR